MAIKRKEIIEALHAGIREASRTYELWSQGWTLSKSGVESLLVVEIARKLYKKMDTPESMRLEVLFEDIIDRSGANRRGRPRDNTSGQKKPDITLFNGRKRPTCVIEVKRTVNWKTLTSDLDRLRDIVIQCGKERGGTLKRGFLVVYQEGDTEYFCDGIGDYFQKTSNSQVRHGCYVKRFGTTSRTDDPVSYASVVVEITKMPA